MDNSSLKTILTQAAFVTVLLLAFQAGKLSRNTEVANLQEKVSKGTEEIARCEQERDSAMTMYSNCFAACSGASD